MSVFAVEKVLVLNRNWLPIRIVDLARAIKLLFSTCNYQGVVQPKARIIDAAHDFQTFTWEDWSKIRPRDGEDCINAVHWQFKIPRVILLTKYEKMPTQRVHFSRRSIYRRDNYTCQYCGKRPGSEELSIDHIMPKSRGGKTSWDNCVLCCVACNVRKSNRTPEQAGMKLLSKPSRPKFNLFKSDRTVIPEDWSNFISEVYWSTELSTD